MRGDYPGDNIGLYLPKGWVKRIDEKLKDFSEWAGGVKMSRNRFIVALIAVGLEAGYDDMLKAATAALQDQARKALERAIRRMGVKHERD